MAEDNVKITKSDIKHIICTGELPLSTGKDKVRITHRVLSNIFSVIGEEFLSPKDVIAPCLTLLCGWDGSNVLDKPSNFLRSKSIKSNNKKKLVNLDDIVPEFILQPQNTDQPSSSNFLGKHCEKFSVERDIFDKILEGKKDISKVLLSNGALLELEMERSKRNLTRKSFSQIITDLSDIPDASHLTDDFLRHQIIYRSKNIPLYRKKQKRPFTIFDTSKSNGWFYVLGLHEVGSGDAQAQLDLLKEVVGDVNEFAKKYFSENFFSSVKNLMSDQCNTRKV